MKYLNKHLKFTLAGLLGVKPTLHVCVSTGSMLAAQMSRAWEESRASATRVGCRYTRPNGRFRLFKGGN